MEPVNPLRPALRLGNPNLLRHVDSKTTAATHSSQQQASAEYWFAMGLSYKEKAEWTKALLCFSHVTELDATYWRAWLLSGLACAHLNKLEECCLAIIGSEVHGRPATEHEFFNYFVASDLVYVINFLEEQKGQWNEYKSHIALALFYFHNNELNAAKSLLVPLAIGRTENAAWACYFLSRVEFMLCDFKASVCDLEFMNENFIRVQNARVYFWLAKAQMCAGRDELKDFREWESSSEAQNANYFYLDYHQVFGYSSYNFKQAIKIGPPRAEYYFLLGETYRIYGGRGAGFDEYHEAVKLDPQNEKYILTRVLATWSGPDELDYSEASTLIAYAEAADIRPADISYIVDSAIAFYQLENYASALIMFDKCSELKFSDVTDESRREIIAFKVRGVTKMRNDCAARIGWPLGLEVLQTMADAERAHWRTLSLANLVFKRETF